ncbi:hypothetical protein KIPB_012804, partial [Kipferlia bialata]
VSPPDVEECGALDTECVAQLRLLGSLSGRQTDSDALLSSVTAVSETELDTLADQLLQICTDLRKRGTSRQDKARLKQEQADTSSQLAELRGAVSTQRRVRSHLQSYRDFPKVSKVLEESAEVSDPFSELPELRPFSSLFIDEPLSAFSTSPFAQGNATLLQGELPASGKGVILKEYDCEAPAAKRRQRLPVLQEDGTWLIPAREAERDLEAEAKAIEDKKSEYDNDVSTRKRQKMQEERLKEVL